MRIRTLAWAAALVLAVADGAWAQRVEVSGLVGWTFSDGVESDEVLAGDGNTYDAIDVKDGASWGVDLGVYATDRVQVGVVFNQQQSTLDIVGTATREVGDLTINTFHPYVAYNFGSRDASARPYVLIGFGATTYGSVTFTRANGQQATTDSDTQYSTTVGAGVKVFAGPRVGFRLGMQYTPTYIKTDSEGWWCDSYWGCYVVGNRKYSNQLTLNGGVVIRF